MAVIACRSPTSIGVPGAENRASRLAEYASSSTLAAVRTIRDTLAGPKRTLWLVPSILADLRAFGCNDLSR